MGHRLLFGELGMKKLVDLSVPEKDYYGYDINLWTGSENEWFERQTWNPVVADSIPALTTKR